MFNILNDLHVQNINLYAKNIVRLRSLNLPFVFHNRILLQVLQSHFHKSGLHKATHTWNSAKARMNENIYLLPV